MNTEALSQLASRLRGTVSTPADPSYDDARVWNGTVDKKPAVIVTCQGVADVIDAVNFARDQALPVSVRGGGHHVSGSAVIDAGLVSDLSQMRSVRVDAQQSPAPGRRRRPDRRRRPRNAGLRVCAARPGL